MTTLSSVTVFNGYEYHKWRGRTQHVTWYVAILCQRSVIIVIW